MIKTISFSHLLKRFPKTLRECAFNVRYVSSETIEIPIRIKRGPTDILKALASTVKVDTTGPEYKFHDDPFLTPVSISEKRNFSLSKEAGRKAARSIKDDHGDIFHYQADDPIIKDFLPKVKYEEKDVNEDTLLEAITNVQVTEAIDYYRLCKDNNREVSRKTQQSLLELLCYFNCENAPDGEWIEERLQKYVEFTSLVTKTWKERGIAEELFENLKEDGREPYCAIIRGMCNYYQCDRAWDLFQEALEKKLFVDTNTYNAIIRMSNAKGDDYESKWMYVINLLEKMAENKVPVNLGTLNATLESLKNMLSWNISARLCLQVLKEFELLGVEPSPASYFYILKIYSRKRNYSGENETSFQRPTKDIRRDSHIGKDVNRNIGPSHHADDTNVPIVDNPQDSGTNFKRRSPPGLTSSSVLASILYKIRGKSFTLRDVNDTWFYCTAMENCRDIELADQIHSSLLVGNNYLLLGEQFKSNLYYRNYLLQSLRELPFQEFFKVYDRLVPFVYTPDPYVMEELLLMCDVLDEAKEVPRIWSDIVVMNHQYIKTLLQLLLTVISKFKLESLDEILSSRLDTVASTLFDQLEAKRNSLYNRDKIEWTTYMIGDCISILARCGNATKALQILLKIIKEPAMIPGAVPVEALQYLFKALLELQNEQCFTVVRYAKENDFLEADEMALEMTKSEFVSNEIKEEFIRIFGTNIKQPENTT